MSPASSPNAPLLNPAREAFRCCRLHLQYAVLFSAFINAAYLAPTLFMLGVYDMVVPSGSGSTLVFCLVALAVTLVVLTLLERARAALLLKASLRLDKIFGPRLIASALRKGAAPSELSLVSSLREFDKIRAAVTGPAAVALFDTPWILIYIGVCFYLHPAIGSMTLASAGLLLVLAIWNERSTREFSEQTLRTGAESAVVLDGAGGSADVVRALGMGETMLARVQGARATATWPAIGAARINGDIAGLIRFLRLMLQSAALALGAWLAINHQISGGAIFASSMLAARALAPIDAIVAQWRAMSQALSAYRAVQSQLNAVNLAPPTALPAPRPRLTVQDLVVATPRRDRIVLGDVRFGAEGGEIVGVLGASGAGKTTLMQTLAHARQPLQGEIRLDGARYADWDPDRLGRYVGYVPQDSVLFPGTVKANICRFDTLLGGEMKGIDENVISAARRAGVHEMILGLPSGYETLLGPRGEGLSAGQRQRIALARAMYGEPLLYVLDEPNANLDAEGEAALVETISQLRATGALVIISVHRLGLVAIADKLLVLRGGRMERFGSRQEVLTWLKAQERPRAPTPERTFGHTAAPGSGVVQIVGASSL